MCAASAKSKSNSVTCRCACLKIPVPAESFWTDAQIEAFISAAPTHIARVVLIALWTGQRQGDILSLTWSAHDGRTIRLRQSKTGRHLSIPVATPLRAALTATRMKAKDTDTICTTSRGQPWTRDGFRTSFGKACVSAQITGLTFHDLRGTAVARLALAGATVPESATITGHSPKDVETILNRHYFSRDRALGESAIAKLEKHEARTQSANEAVNGSGARNCPTEEPSTHKKGGSGGEGGT